MHSKIKDRYGDIENLILFSGNGNKVDVEQLKRNASTASSEIQKKVQPFMNILEQVDRLDEAFSNYTGFLFIPPAKPEVQLKMDNDRKSYVWFETGNEIPYGQFLVDLYNIALYHSCYSKSDDFKLSKQLLYQNLDRPDIRRDIYNFNWHTIIGSEKRFEWIEPFCYDLFNRFTQSSNYNDKIYRVVNDLVSVSIKHSINVNDGRKRKEGYERLKLNETLDLIIQWGKDCVAEFTDTSDDGYVTFDAEYRAFFFIEFLLKFSVLCAYPTFIHQRKFKDTFEGSFLSDIIIDKLSEFSPASSLLQTDKDGKQYTVSVCTNLATIIYIDLVMCKKYNIKLNICRNCGKGFISLRDDNCYCNDRCRKHKYYEKKKQKRSSDQDSMQKKCEELESKYLQTLSTRISRAKMSDKQQYENERLAFKEKCCFHRDKIDGATDKHEEQKLIQEYYDFLVSESVDRRSKEFKETQKALR